MTPSLEDIEAWAAAGEAATRLDAAAGDANWMRTLARAMARDAALLRRRPELTLPCVTRLAGLDPSLAPLLDDWRRAWRATRRGRWLRALIPPVVSVTGPLLAEVAGDDDVDGFEPSEPAAARYALAHGAWGWLTCVELAIDTQRTVAVDDDSSFTTLATLDDDEVLAGGWWGDYDGVLIRASPRTGLVRWRIELPHAVSTIAIAPRAHRAFVHDGRGGYLIDLDDGAVIGSTTLVDADAALSADAARLLTRGGGVRRLWDVAGLLADESRAPRRGFVAAEFDRDGALVLRGGALHDARSGALLANLDVDGPGYLEGGPPEHGRRVIPDGFIEARPFGLRRWDRTGACVLEDRRRHFTCRDLVRFASDGALLAFRRGDTGPLRIMRTDVDVEVARSVTETTDAVAWSPRDHTLVYTSTTGEVRRMTASEVGRWDDRVIDAQPEDEPTHPWQCRWQAGVATIEDRHTGEEVAAVRSDHPLVPDVTGTRWAAVDGLFALGDDD